MTHAITTENYDKTVEAVLRTRRESEESLICFDFRSEQDGLLDDLADALREDGWEVAFVDADDCTEMYFGTPGTFT